MNDEPLSAVHGFGRVPGARRQSVPLPPLKALSAKEKRGKRKLVVGGVSFYLFDAVTPPYWNPKTYLSRRGGWADALIRFSREHARHSHLASRFYDVLGYREAWEREFDAGTPCDLYEVNLGHGTPRLAERFVDLRPYLEADNPFSKRPWRDHFTPQAQRAMGLGAAGSSSRNFASRAPGVTPAKGRRPHTAPREKKQANACAPVCFLVIDFSAAAINFNRTALASLGLSPPFDAWPEWVKACERAQQADYQWPIALAGAFGTPGLNFLSRSVQDQLFVGLASHLRQGARGPLTGEDWRRALEKRLFAPDTPEVLDFLRMLKDLSRFFVWYFTRYDSIHTKPFYFSRRPQCLFRVGDFRRVRMDNENHARIRDGRRQFPFEEGAMPAPLIPREMSPFASETRRGLLEPSFKLGISAHLRGDRAFEDALGFLQWFTCAEQQREFTRWAYSVPGIRGVKPVAALRGVAGAREAFSPPSLLYGGFTAETERAFHENLAAYLEPTGTLSQFQARFEHILAADLQALSARR